MTQGRLRKVVRLGAAALPLAAPLCAEAQDDASRCAAIADDPARLACYDALFRARQPVERAAPPAAAPSIAAPPAPTRGDAAAPAERPAGPDASALVRAWELDPAHKRGTFVVRTYLPNYLLPLHYTTRLNRAPASPTHPAVPSSVRLRPLEAKLQISLRAKVAEGLGLPDADLWFAYTQRSLWQVWNRAESAPFRSSDYMPEAIYVVPVPARLGSLAGGWRLRFLQAGVAHQSNGEGDPLSRSWNRVSVGAAAERGDFALRVRADRRFRLGSGIDDNPDLTRFIGSTDVTASWIPGRSVLALNWRTGGHSLRRGSLQLDWSYPLRRDQPGGLRWYVQLFTGYGETLLDYNVPQTTLATGVSLFQF